MVLDKIPPILPSRVSMLYQVMDALRDPDLNMIGIYGIEGVGKTTLTKEVHRKAVEDKLFDCVVMVAVSKTPELLRIQGEIAAFLGLKFNMNEAPASRASRLYNRLTSSKSKVLIILDDIWAKLDLGSVGIDFGGLFVRRPKILLTSRRRDVCYEMGTQKDFLLEVLHEEEARSLFQMTMGEAKDPELQAIANDIVKRCAGLPLLVIIVATYLINKKLSAWRDIFKKLSDFGKEELHEIVHMIVKSIYENLPNNEVKSFLSLCALFGEPNIPINYLLTYTKGLDLFGNITGLQDARGILFQMIEKLKTESLLLDGDMNGYVKMHDVVLDVARSIATKEQHAFYGINGQGLREWSTKDRTRIVLPYCDINELPLGLEYPETELFSLFSKDIYLKIPALFFEGFRELKVLNLRGMCFMSLPTSLHFLTNLHSLYLQGCQLVDVTTIGDLKQLEFLSFADSCIVKLPKQIEQLSHLKLLDTTNCTQLKVFLANVLSKLSLLEELYMGNSFVRWDMEGNMSVMELEELHQLKTLEIQLIDAKRIPECLFLRRLQRYRISIGDKWTWDETYEASKILKLRLKTINHMKDGLKELLGGTQALYLDNVRGIKNLLYDIDGKGCQQLKHLHIRNNDFIQHINSTRWASCLVFPILETLSLDNLKSLKVICYGQLQNGSFGKLQILKISKCHELRNLFSPQLESIFKKMVIFPNLTSLILRECGSLKYIFKSSTIKSLLQLKRLAIECCDFVEEIILAEESIDEIIFPNLDFLRLADLPSLKKFGNDYPIKFQSLREIEINECRKLKNIVSNISNKGDEGDMQSIFNDKVTFPNLQIMSISNMNLEHIWCSQLTADSFCRLKSLFISRCWKLLIVFPSNLVRRFQRLEDLYIHLCPKIEEIYQLEELNSNGEVTPFELRHLYIHKMPSLKHIWSIEDGDGLVNFQNLKSVEAHECEVMEYVFPAPIACSLLQLKQLEIWHCGVKYIIEKGKSIEVDDEAPHTFDFPELTSLRLQNLWRLRSFYPKTYLCEWPKLKYLEIRGCHKAITLDVKVNSDLETLILECKSFIKFSNELIFRLKVIELSHMDDEDYGENDITIVPLRYLKLKRCERLKYIAPSSVSFQNLTTLHVSFHGNLVNLVTASTAKTMVHLIELRITYCVMMKEIVADNGDETKHEIIFNHLKCLVLQHLPSLNSFCSRNYVFHFPLLEQVIVEQCLRMKIFCGGVLSTPKLSGLQPYNSNENYKKQVQYWNGDLNETITSQSFRRRALQDAYKWDMIEDPSSSKAILANELQYLYNLRKINIRECDSLQVVFVGPWHGGFLPKLEELQLINLPKLSELWNKNPMRMFEFRKLRLLKVQNCSSLKYAFTQSMVPFLVELQQVEVENCKMMEAIIKAEIADKTKVSKMTLPSLKKISIKGCPSMKGFMSPILSREQIISMQEIHEIAMPRLEVLIIDWDIQKLNGNNQSDFFYKPKFFELVFPSNNFPTMEEFVLSDALVEELIIYGLDNHHDLLPRLRKIILSKLPNLTYMVYDDDPRRVSIFQNLQVLQVWECNNLTTLVSCFVYFQNLTFLQVSKCHRLINLITTSIAKSLVQLKTMYVGRCKMMEEIVAIESDGEEDEIRFPRLEYLVLDDLPRQTSFCSSKNSFYFPYLEELLVIKCPKMKMFARAINTPKLSQVQTGEKAYEWKWEGNLNSTIQTLYIDDN